MARTKEYNDAWQYVQRIRDLWQALQMSQQEHGRRVWPFPGLPNIGSVRVGSKTTLNGLYGVAMHAAKLKDLNIWFLKNNRVQNDDWAIIDRAYRDAHQKFCDANSVNHKMSHKASWECAPAPSIMSEQQTIAVEQAINEFIRINDNKI